MSELNVKFNGGQKAIPAPATVADAIKAFDRDVLKSALAAKVNPVDNLGPLAANRVPLLHVYGDADDVVPWDENTGLIAERYRAIGGEIRLICKPGVGHHPHGLDDSTPIIEFIAEHAGRD